MASRNQQDSNITQYRKPLNINIGMIIFSIMALYIIVLVISYFQTSHIVGYEVKMGSLFVDKSYTGMAIRSEEVINSPYTGYVNFYIREGERVSYKDIVYSVDESGKLSDMIQNGSFDENSFTDDDLQEFKSSIVNYARTFQPESFSSVYDFKYDVDGTVIKMVNFNTYENIDALNSSNLNGLVNLCSTGKSGYIVYNTDGYESINPSELTADMFNQDNYEKARVNSNDLIDKGTSVCKLVTDEHWSIVIPLDDARAAELADEDYIKVKFTKNQNTAWAAVQVIDNPDGKYGILSFTNSVMAFCTDRFVDIELLTSDEEGLKIPNSAIVQKEFIMIPEEYMTKGGATGSDGVTKEFYDENGKATYNFVETNVYNIEDGMYYVDNVSLSLGDEIVKEDSTDVYTLSQSGTLIGVYNINKGYADFKQITILYQNDEYAIVSSTTAYGLTVYDRIVLNAESVNDDDFIF